MGKMYTLKPDESINDHVKDSIAILNHIVELSISCMRDLANPHEGTFVDMTYNDFMYAIEHVRNSIEMLDELCDELEDDKDGIRQEYEEKVIQFFNRFMNSNLADEHNYRERELARLVHQLDNRCFELDKELEKEREKSNQLEKRCEDLEHQLKEEHERYMKLREAKEQSPTYWKAKFERMQKKSNQLEQQLITIKSERDLAKKLAKKLMDEKRVLKNNLTSSELELKALREVLDKKYDEIESLTQQLINSSPNNPQNFCGNCKYFAFVAKEDGMHGCCHEQYLKEVDPDDASCNRFCHPCDKPDHEVCDNCDSDCDTCGYYPF